MAPPSKHNPNIPTPAPKPPVGAPSPVRDTLLEEGLRQVMARNRAMDAASHQQGPNPLLIDRQGPRRTNLPIESAESRAIKESEQQANATRNVAARAVRDANGGAKAKWLKIGLQRTLDRGLVLHTEYMEGDKRVKETVQTHLSPLAAREKLALHLVAIYGVFE